jgi:hypothetical protein
MSGVCLKTNQWSRLPLPEAWSNGIQRKPNCCVGCNKAFDTKDPSVHRCIFRHEGFPWVETGRAQACDVQYHAGCVRAGAPFATRLANDEGLVMPWQVPLPHYVCELCMVRGQLQRELRHRVQDIVLLLLERM